MKTEKKRLSSQRGRTRLFAILLAVVGIAVSLSSAHISRSNETQRIVAAFTSDAEKTVSIIRRELTQFYDVLESLGQLHSLSSNIDADAFAEFVQKGMLYQRNILEIFGLAPRVRDRARKAYEQAMQASGREQFSFREKVGDEYQSAGRREQYFPVTYVVPPGRSSLPFGLDLGSDLVSLKAMQETVRQKKPRAGGWIETGTNRQSRLILSPIMRRYPGMLYQMPSLNWLDGFAFALLDPERIIGNALRLSRAEDITLHISERQGEKNSEIYSTVDKPFVEQTGDNAIVFEESLSFGGLDWRVLCTPTRHFIFSRRTILPWVILFGGLLLTAIIVTQILHLAGRADQVRRLVEQRTSELKQANNELASEIEQRHKLQREILDISTQEKRRLGQDLHDSLGQHLTGIGLLVSGLARSLKASSAPGATEARQIAELLKEARVQTRRMARGLTPVELDVEGLPDAIERLAAEMQEVSDVECAVIVESNCNVPDADAAVHLYHIAQEAMNNAVKHAGAQHISVILSVDGLCVLDDGKGMPQEYAGDRMGLGLKIMQYRAEMIDGVLAVRENEPQGTIVECLLKNNIREM